jgi:hypothetical protein
MASKQGTQFLRQILIKQDAHASGLRLGALSDEIENCRDLFSPYRGKFLQEFLNAELAQVLQNG